MDARLGITGISLAALLAVGSAPVRADIYTWIDSAGTVNYSDTPPPRGMRVTGVVHDSPAKMVTSTEAEAAREAARQAEMDALNARIRLLEREIDLANRAAPPPVQYVSAPPPAPPSSCDYWGDCESWWSPSFFAPPVVVIQQHRFHHFDHGRQFHHWDTRGGFMRH
jgi:hypothetical protein